MVGLFDMSVEHRAVGLESNFMGGLMDLDPLGRVGLVLADLIANFRMENFRTSPWHASQSSFAEIA